MAAATDGRMASGSAPDAKRLKIAMFSEVESTESRQVEGKPVPLVYKCHDSSATLADAVSWITSTQPEIEKKLSMHGAILFRGFPLKTADDFDEFVSAFAGWSDLSYEDSLSFAVRVQKANRICTTNEGKTGGLVFHHEQAQSPRWPSKLFFCCELAAKPGDGGETGVCRSDQVLKALEAAEPEFCKKLEEVGVKYTIYMGSTADTASGVGRSWKSYFGGDTKEACEARMKSLGYTWKWYPDGSLVATTPRLDAIKVAPGTSTRCFFNQLPATLNNALEFCGEGVGDLEYVVGEAPPAPPATQAAIDKCLSFGDGSPVPVEKLQVARALCEEHAVNLKWQSGDIALLDNYLVMHARRIWKGEVGTRKLLASLCK